MTYTVIKGRLKINYVFMNAFNAYTVQASNEILTWITFYEIHKGGSKALPDFYTQFKQK